MYAFKEVRCSGITSKVLDTSLEFARNHYDICYLEIFANMERAKSFYKKNGFISLDKPLIATEHYACDMWYLKHL